MSTRGKFHLGMFASALLFSGQCLSDSWVAPHEITYDSPDRKCRFTVTPRCCVAGTAAAEDGSPPLGRLECRKTGGKFREVWRRELVNRIAPADALVGNGGEHVVTFDDWGKVGTSPNTVVIYGRDGVLEKRLALRDFLTGEEIDRLLATTSSIWWGRGHRIDAKRGHLVLRIAGNNSLARTANAEVWELPIDLRTGVPVRQLQQESMHQPTPENLEK